MGIEGKMVKRKSWKLGVYYYYKYDCGWVMYIRRNDVFPFFGLGEERGGYSLVIVGILEKVDSSLKYMIYDISALDSFHNSLSLLYCFILLQKLSSF